MWWVFCDRYLANDYWDGVLQVTTQMPGEDNFLFWVPPSLFSSNARAVGRHFVSGPQLFLLNHMEHPSHTEIIFRLQVIFHA